VASAERDDYEGEGPLERRLRLQQLLYENSAGFTAEELAERLDCSVRTVQRDLLLFRGILNKSGDQLEPPLEPLQGRYRLRPGEYPIPILRLDTNEARALLFSLRLLSRSSTEQDSDALALMTKVAAVFPGALADQVAFTRSALHGRPHSKEQTRYLHLLTEAWMRRRTVVMRYQAVGRDKPQAVCFQPYLMEPSASTGATYLVGFNHTRGRIGTFKLDRVRRVDPHHRLLCPDGLEAHDSAPREGNAEIMASMSRSWSGVVLADGHYQVVVDFFGDSATRVRESPWHPTQRFEELPDGRLRLSLELPELFDFVPWVLSWGKEAQVVAPAELVAAVDERRR
jgi:predicted DNA-binding transcriptional regulator YafY